MSNPEEQTVIRKTEIANEQAREAAMDAARCPLWVDMQLQTTRIPAEAANSYGEDLCVHEKWWRRLSPDFYLSLLNRMMSLKKAADQDGKVSLEMFNEMCRRFRPIEEWARTAYSPTVREQARQRLEAQALPDFPGVEPKTKPKRKAEESKTKEYVPFSRPKRSLWDWKKKGKK